MQSSIKILEADKLVQTPATTNTNYWSPLYCPVEEQIEDDDNNKCNHQILLIISTPKTKNKIAEKW
jgi:hypothetical protein